ncbi:YhjD/YihY/BrkB family envelope integrity protein [Piscinibacter sakaiensis]|uniref:YihY/virulence factor BrkB family protein n=1 Tax=Piscinibacter sakaiensis TaxID=1547922 RepID=UPI003AAB7A9D
MAKPNNPLPSGLATRFHELVWGPREPALPGWQAWGLRVVRTVSMLVRDIVDGQLTLRAMSLVYTTLLSIVPLLALSFSVLKGFGVSNQIRPILLQVLEPLGPEGEVVANQIVGFIQNMNVGVLGALGLGLLLYTAISLIQKIEEALNHIWHIPQSRRLGERFSRYLSVLLVGPILVFSAIGLTATVMNIDTVRGILEISVLSQAVQVMSRLMPYLLVIAAFTFVYMFIPNTRVRLLPALVGGAVGGIAWQSAGWIFAVFVASSNKYAAIYSGFAILILFMIWLYLSWLVLLFGASIAFYVQHPEYLYAGGGEPRLSNRVRERLALSVMSLAAGRFQRGEPAPALHDFTRAFGVPSHSMLVVVDALLRSRMLCATDAEPSTYIPARDPAQIPVAAILQAVRAAGEDMFMTPAQLPAPAPVEAALAKIDQAVDAGLGGISLRELATPAAVERVAAGGPTAADGSSAAGPPAGG